MPPGRSWPAAAGSDPWLPGVSPSRGRSPCCSELGSLGCSPSPTAHSTAPFGHACLFFWLDPPSLAHSPPPPRGPPHCFQAVGHVTSCLSVCSPAFPPDSPLHTPQPCPARLAAVRFPISLLWGAGGGWLREQPQLGGLHSDLYRPRAVSRWCGPQSCPGEMGMAGVPLGAAGLSGSPSLPLGVQGHPTTVTKAGVHVCMSSPQCRA